VRVAPTPYGTICGGSERRKIAKEAFAKAVEWHVAEQLINVTISDGTKSYTVFEFSSAMALLEIANTVEAATEMEPKAKGK
jgi:hypothetical protein